MRSREIDNNPGEQAMMSKSKFLRKNIKCYHIKYHIKRDCKVSVKFGDGWCVCWGRLVVVLLLLVVCLKVGSGATSHSHMCHSRDLFVTYKKLQKPPLVTEEV